jgi:hypothetical protein
MPVVSNTVAGFLAAGSRFRGGTHEFEVGDDLVVLPYVRVALVGFVSPLGSCHVVRRLAVYGLPDRARRPLRPNEKWRDAVITEEVGGGGGIGGGGFEAEAFVQSVMDYRLGRPPGRNWDEEDEDEDGIVGGGSVFALDAAAKLVAKGKIGSKILKAVGGGKKKKGPTSASAFGATTTVRKSASSTTSAAARSSAAAKTTTGGGGGGGGGGSKKIPKAAFATDEIFAMEQFTKKMLRQNHRGEEGEGDDEGGGRGTQGVHYGGRRPGARAGAGMPAERLTHGFPGDDDSDDGSSVLSGMGVPSSLRRGGRAVQSVDEYS